MMQIVLPSMMNRAMLGLRRLVAGFWLQRPVFSPRPNHMGFVVDQLTLQQIILQMLWFSIIGIIPALLLTYSFISHQCYVISATDSAIHYVTHLTPLLPKGLVKFVAVCRKS